MLLNYIEEHQVKTNTLAYRPDLDGMRGIAILLVLIYHLFPSLLPGGFIGVDLFFVISGYLISSIIFREINNNTFSFVNFYARRIKRIFPTLLIVLILVSLIGWIVCYPSEYFSLGEMLNSTTYFATNFSLHKYIGYFNKSATTPLLNLWSLGVEEQFYILFPIVIFIIFKIKPRILLLPSILLGIVVSFSLNIFFIKMKPSAVFYLLPCRAWEVLVGALLAYSKIFGIRLVFAQKITSYFATKVVHNIMAIGGLLVILCTALLLKETKQFPGWWALIPVIVALLFIIADKSWLNFCVLSNRIIILVGIISYSLYLWHWPLLSFFQIYTNSQVSIISRIGILITSFVLSIITTFLVEKPLRQGNSKVVYYLIGLMLLFSIFSFGIYKGYIKTLSVITTPELSKIDFAMSDWVYPTNTEYNKNLNNRDVRNFPFHSFGKGENIVAFFGDSNIQQYWPRVEKLLLNNSELYNKYTVVFVTYGGQIPIFKSHKDYGTKKFLKVAEEFLNNYSLKAVVVGAQWCGYMSGDEKKSEDYYNSLQEILGNFRNQSKKTYLILNMPMNAAAIPQSMFKRNLLKNWEVQSNSSFSGEQWLADSKKVSDRLKKIAKETNTTVINPYHIMCPKDRCRILDDQGYPIYKDGCHITASYVRESAVFIDQIFH